MWGVRSNLVHLGEIRKTRCSCIKSCLLDVGYIYRGTSGSKLAKSSNTFHFYWPSGFLSLDSAFLLFEAQQFVAEPYLGRYFNQKKSSAVEIPFPFLIPWKSPTNLPIGYPKFRPTTPPTRRNRWRPVHLICLEGVSTFLGMFIAATLTSSSSIVPWSTKQNMVSSWKYSGNINKKHWEHMIVFFCGWNGWIMEALKYKLEADTGFDHSLCCFPVFVQNE